MDYLKNVRSYTRLAQKCLLLVVSFGLLFPGVSVAQSSDTFQNDSTQEFLSENVLADGTYLYGQSRRRDELGITYTIFSIQDNQTIGAFYQPHSSFDCFSGQITPTKLSVNIVDSYEQAVYPYEIAVTIDNNLSAGEAAGTYTIEGFHRIEEISDKDREILAICQADLND